jgi:tRNA A-37 threonylcarbamoyl transferase component Bud32
MTNAAPPGEAGERASFVCPAGVEILEANGKGGTGNVTLLFRDTNPPLVLKIFRTRGSARRERMRTLSNFLLEGKRGAGARQRMRTETASLSVWAREGFAVPALVERARPALAGENSLWLSYMEGVPLSARMEDPSADWSQNLEILRRYARETARRHRRAFALREPLLTHEHPAACHVMVVDGELYTFDFENGYRPGFSVEEAAASEVAGFLRTVARHARDRAPAAIRAYGEGYEERELLSQLLRHYIEGRSLYRRLKRAADRRRRNEFGKTWSMQMLRVAMGLK